VGWARRLFESLKGRYAVAIDDDEQSSPGFKFAEAELQGIPLRVEVGPKDIEKDQVVLVRRDTGQKLPTPRGGVESRIGELLEEIQNNLFHRALAFRKDNTHSVEDYEGFKALIEAEGGFLECGWCGQAACEQKVKEDTKATIRVLPLGREEPAGPCVVCGQKAHHLALFAKAY
jgi:prolyl-tRNA synthetase